MFQHYYKESVDVKGRQEERRWKLLNEQRTRRLEQQDEKRNLSADSYHIKKYGLKEISKKYHLHKNEISLQISEWMRECPENLSEWLLVPCPPGKRCMIVAEGGITLMFNKNGKFCFKFRSKFPGGGGDYRYQGLCTILDCIYSNQTNTFYILDVVCYGQQSMLNCETQFRYFWLHSQFHDNDNCFSKLSANNEKVFKLLDVYDMSNEKQISHVMMQYPLWPNNSPKLDGFLFYHKESSYTCGTTPLVCWLFAFMVPEILHIDVNSAYCKPANYTNALLYMDAFDMTKILKDEQKKKPKPAFDHKKLEDNYSVWDDTKTNDDEYVSSL